MEQCYVCLYSDDSLVDLDYYQWKYCRECGCTTNTKRKSPMMVLRVMVVDYPLDCAEVMDETF